MTAGAKQRAYCASPSACPCFAFAVAVAASVVSCVVQVSLAGWFSPSQTMYRVLCFVAIEHVQLLLLYVVSKYFARNFT